MLFMPNLEKHNNLLSNCHLTVEFRDKYVPGLAKAIPIAKTRERSVAATVAPSVEIDCAERHQLPGLVQKGGNAARAYSSF